MRSMTYDYIRETKSDDIHRTRYSTSDPYSLVSSTPEKLSAMHSFLRPKFRHFVTTLILCSAQALAASEKLSLVEDTTPGRLTKVQVALEVTGELKINADGKKVIPLAILGKGELLYDEKLVSVPDNDTSLRAARYYHAAAAQSRVGDKDVTATLGKERRLIGVLAEESKVTLNSYSTSGPLTSDELELIDVQANSLLLHRLLPSTEVSVGDTWTHDEKLAAALFGFDVVIKNSLESVLKRVEGKIVHIELTGSTSGSVGGISSEVEANAKYSYDLDKRCITWLAMSIKENRAVGHAEPGFDLTGRLRVSITPTKEAAPELAADLPRDSAAWLTFKSQEGGFLLVHDRNWRLMIDRHDVTVLRFIDRGELVAQCNISRLPDAAEKKQLAMTSFQTDIQRVLDKNFGQFVDSAESKSERGLRVLRTVVSGISADLPIQWTYYHLTDDKGRQASLVFTMDAKLVERFGGADQAIVSTFTLVDREVKPTAAASKPTVSEKKKR